MADDSQIGILGALWLYKWMSAAIVLVMVLLSLGAALLVAPRAQATATIALSTPPANSVLAPGIQGDASLARYTAQRAGFVTSDAVLGAVAEELGNEDITALRADLSASPSSTSNTIVITAEADTGEEAVKLAAATVAAYSAETEKDVRNLTDSAVKSIDETSQAIQNNASNSVIAQTSAANTLSELAIQASEIRTSSALFGDGVDFVIAPRADAVTLPSIPVREAAVGFVLGLVLAATAAWIRANPKRSST